MELSQSRCNRRSVPHAVALTAAATLEPVVVAAAAAVVAPVEPAEAAEAAAEAEEAEEAEEAAVAAEFDAPREVVEAVEVARQHSAACCLASRPPWLHHSPSFAARAAALAGVSVSGSMWRLQVLWTPLEGAATKEEAWRRQQRPAAALQ